MKKVDLEKKLRKAGCFLKREGSSHSLWINQQTGVVEAVPRHKEIKEPLSKKILRNLDAGELSNMERSTSKNISLFRRPRKG